MRWAPIILIAIAAFLVRQVWFAPRPSVNFVDMDADRYHSEQAPRVFAGGIVEGTHRELSLRFELPGRIKAVHVRQGDTVKSGDLLAELETGIAELNLAEANVRLKMAVAERDQLVADAKRLARHLTRDVVPATGDPLPNSGVVEPMNRPGPASARPGRTAAAIPLQHASAQAESPQVNLTREEQIIADGKIAVAEAAVRRETLLLNQRRLLSPVDGIVLRATLEPGELTGPTDEGGLLTVVNRDAIHVRAFVEELDALRVSPGQCAVVTAAGDPDRPYRGIVRTCSPDVRPKSHRHLKAGERLDVRVREIVVELDEGTDLLIGLPVDVFIEPSQAPAVARHSNRSTL